MLNNQPKDKSAAALAFATMLSENIAKQRNPMQGEQPTEEMPQEAPTEASQTPETAPGEEIAPETQDTPPQDETPQEPQENEQMTKLTKDFDEFKGKIEGVIETKFNDLTQTLKDALK